MILSLTPYLSDRIEAAVIFAVVALMLFGSMPRRSRCEVCGRLRFLSPLGSICRGSDPADPGCHIFAEETRGHPSRPVVSSAGSPSRPDGGQPT